ncbi:MAG: hypothetical protein AAGD35_03615 [Actinomycetota bacterium]
MSSARSTTRLLRGRRGAGALLTKGVDLLSLDVFGLALEPLFLEPDHQHLLVGTIVGRRFPSISTRYAELRVEAERRARRVAEQQGLAEVSLAGISDHLLELFVDAAAEDASPLPEAQSSAGPETLEHVNLAIEIRQRLDEIAEPSLMFDPEAAARLAIETEVTLLRVLARPNPDAFELYAQARKRGIATALVADSHIPKDLIEEVARHNGYHVDHVVVSSNEGTCKDSGLYQRLLAKAGVAADAAVHLGPDPSLDVEVPRRIGMGGFLSPTPAPDDAPELLVGLTTPHGLGSIVLGHAERHLARSDGADDAFDIGYYAAGPLLVGFTVWLASLIDEIDPDHVLLCGPAAPMIDQGLAIVRSTLPDDRRHVLPLSADGHCPVARLATTVPLRQAERLLVADMGLHHGAAHHYVARILGHDAGPERSGPEVTGAYLGLRRSGDDGGRQWAFTVGPDCPVRPRVMERPEIVEAMLRLLPPAAQDVPPVLRPFHAVGRQVGAGALAFAEDVEPWLRLDESSLSAALIEPALRIIDAPTPAEARIFGPYPALATPDRHGDDDPVPLAMLPPRTMVARSPSLLETKAAEAPWTNGYRAMTTGRPRSLRSRQDRTGL